MPNLVGIFDPSADPTALQGDLTRMMDRVDIAAYRFVRRTAFGDGVAVGNVLTGVEDNLCQPVRDEPQGLWLMLDGEILGNEDLRRELLAHGRDVATADDARLALAAYQVWGERFLDRLNGNWNLVLHMAHEGVTILASDRIGSRSLFLAQDGLRLTFASEMKAVVVGRKVDSRAGGFGLLDLVMSGYSHGNYTWIEGVEAFEPGMVVRFDHKRLTRRRYWRMTFNETGPRMSERDYVDGFVHRMKAATERCMRRRTPAHKLAITQSGGLDSRAIALSIDKRHLPITALTYGNEDSADVIYARQIADVVGLDFHYVEKEKDKLFEDSRARLNEILGPSTHGERGFYSTQMDRMVWRDEVAGDQTGSASMIWHPLYCKHMNLMLQGAAGDALTGSHVTWRDMKFPSREQVIGSLFDAQYFQPREIMALVFAPSYLDRWWPEREAIFGATFDDIHADEPIALSSVWDMENRQRRGAFSTFTMERYFCTVRAPFLDYELVDHLRSVPGLWRFQQRVYKKMIVRGFPHAAHIPWAYTRSRLTTSPTYEFAREWTNYWSRRIEKRFFKAPEMPSYAFRDSGALLRDDRENAVAVYEWLKSDRFDPDVFNREGIERLLERHFGGETGEEIYLTYAYVCGFARAHKYILDRGVTTIPDECNPACFGVEGPPIVKDD